MKKNLPLILLLTLLVGTATAQQNVSTEVENKKVLVEEFTGIHCGYCPYAHKIVAEMLKAQPDKVYALAVHAGSYAKPGSDEPDFRLAEGKAINDHFGISGYPAGMINRQRYDNNIVLNRAVWAQYAHLQTEEAAPVNLWMKADYNSETRALTIDVEGYYTADVDASYLNVVLAENNVQGPQSGGGVGSDYMHQHMVRAYITGTWGEAITNCKKGEYFTKQYVYTVPETINGVTLNPGEFELVAYVCENEENVLNVTGCKPVYEGYEVPLAAEIADAMIPIGDTYGYNYFDVALNNKSTEEITSANFVISFNSTDYDVEWIGTAAPRTTTTIRLPFDVNSLLKETGNKYTIKLTGLNGNDYKGNRYNGKFDAPKAATPTIRIEIGSDAYLDENRFLIKDMEGNIVYEVGPFERSNPMLISEFVSLAPNTQYCFEITDSWSNGIYNGFYTIYDANNNEVYTEELIENHGCRTFFKTGSNNVTTEVLKKEVLIEEFTGIHCGNCPDAHYMIAELKKAQGDRIHALAYHAGHYANPLPNEPDYRTTEGDSLDIYFKPDGYPNGMVNRASFDEEGPMYSRGVWVEYSRAICDQDAPVNLWIGSDYNPNTRILTVNVEGYYTGSVDADNNFLNVVIAEDDIVGPQNGGGAGNNYVHSHMVRDFLTPIWGDTITTCQKGDSFTRKYVYEVPKTINGVATNPANFEVVAFVTMDKEDILSVVSERPHYPGLEIPMNAEIQAPLIPVGGTYAYNYYEMFLVNNSTQDIIEAGFDVKLNGVDYVTEWVGFAPARKTTLIRVPFHQADLIEDANDFIIKLGGVNYQLYKGNSISGSFQDPVSTTPHNKFIIKTDNFADENRYLIKDMDGNIIHEFGPYVYGTVTVDTVEIDLPADEVLCFEVTDAWGNGIMDPRGTYKVYNAHGKLVVQQLEIKAHGCRSFFITNDNAAVENIENDNAFAVHYNKADETIVVTPATNVPYQVTIYNMAGQTVYQASASEMLNVDIEAAGVYVVNIVTPEAQMSHKVAVY